MTALGLTNQLNAGVAVLFNGMSPIWITYGVEQKLMRK